MAVRAFVRFRVGILSFISSSRTWQDCESPVSRLDSERHSSIEQFTNSIVLLLGFRHSIGRGELLEEGTERV